MKSYIIFPIRPVIPVFLGLCLAFSCQKLNPLEGVQLTVNTDIYKSPMMIQFVDGSPQSTKIPEGLKVSISGPGKNLVVDDLGGKDFTVAGNILTLVLDRTAKPTEAQPIVFTISVSGPGYLSTSKTITVVDEERPINYVVPLVALSAPPEGVTAASGTVSLNGGTIEAPVGNGKDEGAELTIAPGTQVRDAAGNTINAANVSTQIVHFGTDQMTSLLSFPGGFTPQNVNRNGTVTEGAFVTAGFVAIDMQAGGKEVKSFSKPIEVKIGISDDFVNPDNNQKLQPGDEIPTWSYENSTGEWKEEGVAKVSTNAAGKLIATFTATHLSYWNLDYFYSLGPVCNRYYTQIKVNSNVTSYQSGYQGFLYAGNQVLNGYNFDVTNGAVSYIINPRRANMKVKVMDMTKYPAKPVGETALFNPCAVTTVPINLSLPAPPPPITVDIDFTAKCSGKDVNIKPSAWLFLYEPTGGWYGGYTYGYMQSGKTTVTVKEGKEYFVYAYTAGQYYTGKVTFTKSSSTVQSAGGAGVKGLSGNTTYNASLNRVKLVATYIINDCK